MVVIHVVRMGETVLLIARLYGVTVESIIKFNDLTDPNNLVLGQTLVILFRIRYILSRREKPLIQLQDFMVSPL